MIYPIPTDLQCQRDVLLRTVADAGTPCKLLMLPQPNLAVAKKQREIGGLWVHLIRRSSDRVEHERRDGENRLAVPMQRRGGG